MLPRFAQDDKRGDGARARCDTSRVQSAERALEINLPRRKVVFANQSWQPRLVLSFGLRRLFAGCAIVFVIALTFERILALRNARILEHDGVVFMDPEWVGPARFIPFSGPAGVAVAGLFDQAKAARIARLHIGYSLYILSFEKITKDALSSLGRHRPVRSVTIEGNFEEVPVSLAWLRSFPALEELQFCSGPVRGKERVTAENLPPLASLRVLTVPGSVGSHGWMQILKCKNLQEIWIKQANLTSEELLLATTLPQLKQCHMQLDSGVPEATLADIRMRRPDVKWDIGMYR